MTGKIIRLLTDKNFGFIHTEKAEYFFHRTSFIGDWNSLTVGLEVEFDPMEGQKGPRAENVKLGE